MTGSRGYSTFSSLALSAVVIISVVWTNNAAILISTDTDEDTGSVGFTAGRADATQTDSKIPLVPDDAEKCPPLPDLSKVTHRICEVNVCAEDWDCSSLDFACCFNGCVRSCAPRIQPPLPFDWLEETPVKSYDDLKRNDDTSHNDDEASSSEEADTRPLISGSNALPRG